MLKFHSCPWFDGEASFDSACAECKAAEAAPNCSATCPMASGHYGPCNYGKYEEPPFSCANPWCTEDSLDWECPSCHASAWKESAK